MHHATPLKFFYKVPCIYVFYSYFFLCLQKYKFSLISTNIAFRFHLMHSGLYWFADECSRAGVGDFDHYEVAYAVVLLVKHDCLVLLGATAELLA